MTTNDFVPFLINDRSSSLLHLIDSFQLTESELNDIYDGVFNRMKIAFAPDNTEPISDRNSASARVKQTFDALMAELENDEVIRFEVHPLEAYMIIGMIQTAIVSVGIPENLEKFGRKFVDAFCDRYRNSFPDMVKTIEFGWKATYTSQEYADLIDSEDDSPNPIGEIWEDKFIA